MSITLDAITLSNDLTWASRYSETPVSQVTERSLTGSLIVQTATKSVGRKISLKGGGDYGWVPRSVADALYNKAVIPGLVMTLTYKGLAIQVIFDHESTALQMDRAMNYVAEESDEWIRIDALNFLTV